MTALAIQFVTRYILYAIHCVWYIFLQQILVWYFLQLCICCDTFCCYYTFSAINLYDYSRKIWRRERQWAKISEHLQNTRKVLFFDFDHLYHITPYQAHSLQSTPKKAQIKSKISTAIFFIFNFTPNFQLKRRRIFDKMKFFFIWLLRMYKNAFLRGRSTIN